MFRQAWRHRYEASRVIRRVCRVTAVAWGASGCSVAIALIAAAWTAPTDTAYGLGYGIPWLWAIVLSSWTVHYVHVSLECEKREWNEGRAHKEVELHLKEKMLDKEVDVLQRMRSIAGTGITKEEFDRMVKEGLERRERRERSKELGAGERALSDPSAISGSSGSSGDEQKLKRPRTLSGRIRVVADKV
jgi:hypothetical protein